MKFKRDMLRVIIAIWVAFPSNPALGEQTDLKRKDLDAGEDTVVYSTKLDFDSTMVDGQMKAPQGFFLQGRNKQSLSNMVKLRSNFKEELRNSRSAVKAMIP
jgi:hypothetical protein